MKPKIKVACLLYKLQDKAELILEDIQKEFPVYDNVFIAQEMAEICRKIAIEAVFVTPHSRPNIMTATQEKE